MFVSVELKWFLKQTQDLHDHFLTGVSKDREREAELMPKLEM